MWPEWGGIKAGGDPVWCGRNGGGGGGGVGPRQEVYPCRVLRAHQGDSPSTLDLYS